MSKTRRVMASVLAVAATLGAAACTPPRTAHTQVGPTATPGGCTRERATYFFFDRVIALVRERNGGLGSFS